MVTFKHCTFNGIKQQTGLYGHYVPIVVESCKFTDASQYGIRSTAAGAVIRNSNFTEIKQYGALLYGYRYSDFQFEVTLPPPIPQPPAVSLPQPRHVSR